MFFVSIIIYLSKWPLWIIRNRMECDNIKLNVLIVHIIWTKQTCIRQKNNSETIDKTKLRTTSMNNLEYNFVVR